MRFNADIHHRRSVRLQGHDYSSIGAYFVTICTFNGECLFGVVRDGMMVLNDVGQVVQKCWNSIPKHFQHIELDECVIMPNHLHGIIMLQDGDLVGATHASPVFGANRTRAMHVFRATHTSPLRRPGPKRGSVGAIVGSFKSVVTKQINAVREHPGSPIWQRNYYERVIRSDRELAAIRKYIAENPAKWATDEYHRN